MAVKKTKKPAKEKKVKIVLPKKPHAGVMWECERCGHIKYADESPEECGKCHAIDSYIKVPEEIVEEREKEMEEEAQ